MVRKKVEGNEQQRRAAARQARREGDSPSARKQTLGASKQPAHLPHHEPHEDKMAARHQGKQGVRTADTRAHRAAPAAGDPGAEFAGRGKEYTEPHEQVFRALMTAQAAHDGAGVYLEDVARGSGLPRQEVRALLHDLATTHRLVTELQGSDAPDLGPRFEAKPRL